MDPHSDPRTPGNHVSPDAARAWLYQHAADASTRAARLDAIGRSHPHMRDLCRILAEESRMNAGTLTMLAAILRPIPRPWWARLWRRLRRM